MPYKLFKKGTDHEVREGDTVVDFRGDTAICTGFAPPHSPNSSGRIYVKQEGVNGDSFGFYPSVFGCEVREVNS